MTAVDLCRSQCDSTALQLERVFAGLPTETAAFKPYDDFVSADEVITHLAECVVALGKAIKGEQHSWGSYTMAATTADGRMTEYKQARAAVLEAAFADGSDPTLRHVSSYVVLHDAYHIGQLCAMRAQLEGWDTEAIYG